MKVNFKSIGITLGLVVIACIVFYLNIAIFISGPVHKYNDKIDHQIAHIKKAYTDISDITRHVFHYVVYIGEDKENYVWFNEKGKSIDVRTKDTYDIRKVKQIIKEDYHGRDLKITLGYGYKNPVYVVNFDQGEVLLDYDTFEEIYFLKKGE